ncbi:MULTISPECIES: GmrSD restriction endonuclease domain-containing protein [Elizabethkingia]|uniref:Uncharacterized protein n=1 Tax=Elizabethkingia anophelis TaxID=1117645 RepID=A0A455ZED3_9FLAO|nr:MULTISPECIES: DUF262 domain-containing protein [Elizabethkingia]EHM7981733.1 DUF262 domain-containing protein [Elizabethkingia anophelis]EHM8032231.1 DUF262 domain-containing protein [Elizabethkingia anophelis]EHZ9535185.1 DUF262 domain-containing protein [Elizabethkingia anophelis]EKU3673095.1 DUF262 domain-containing protein [Elizabethkingia anophelis]EKU4210072.1 DUF262 domain-containing protein [Elizabethkingia anophelis]
MKISITQVPQADELSRVIKTVEAVYNDNNTFKKIANYVGFTERQGRYYRLAAIILGLLENDHNNAILTHQGRQLIGLDSTDQITFIRHILRKNALFIQVLSEIENKSNGISKSELLQYLFNIVDGAEETIKRRFNTIINWLVDTNLILIRTKSTENTSEENYYFINLDINGNESENESEKVEIEEVDENSVLEKPFDPTKINIETKTPSLDTLISRISEKEIQMNTESYFQRSSDLWSDEKQSRLIESILIRFPLPAFFFDASDDNNWLVVDGLQRLSSIRNFCVDKSLKLSNLEFLPQLNGLGYSDLSGDLKRILKESQVVIYKIMPGTPVDVKFNIFKRINTGGLVLEPQEIRHALFQGRPADFVKKLANDKYFKLATDNKIKSHRMQDRDFATRFLCFYLLGIENYNSDLDTYMSKAMAKLNDKSLDLNLIEKDFSKSMQLSYDIFGHNSFRKILEETKRTPPINKALFDAISTQFSFLDDNSILQLKSNKNIFVNTLRTALTYDTDFFESVSSSTGAKNNVMKRHSEIRNIINNTLYNS